VDGDSPVQPPVSLALVRRVMKGTVFMSLLTCLALECSLTAEAVSPQGTRQAQEPRRTSQDVVRISADLVQIDVTVTGKDGKPVAGLNREDFELYDNDKRQYISTFAYEETRARRVEEDPEEPRALPRAVTAGELKRVIAFVIDTIHMKPDSVYRTRRMLEEFVDKKMQPGDLVLMLPTGGGSGLLQQFTSDQRILRRAVSRLRPFVHSTAVTPFRSAGIGLGPQRGPLEEFDVLLTLRALNNLVRAMAKLPGRKIGLFISEGVRHLATRTTSDLYDTIGRAARANVVLYTLDPRGLEPLGLSAADDLAGRDASEVIAERRSDFNESQDSLNALAIDTGGRFFRDRNDIRSAVDRMLEENSAYYVLGFQPEAGKWDGKFHKVKVVIRGRPELTVVTRRGYFARDTTEEGRRSADPKVAEMVEAINSPLVRRDIDLQLTPFYKHGEKEGALLSTLLHIDATALNFTQVAGRYTTKLDLTGLLVDSRGQAVDRFRNEVEFKLLPQNYERVLRRGLLSTRTTAVKPGIYQIRIFVRESDSGLIGTAMGFVEVPKIKGDSLALSSIFTDARSAEPDQSLANGDERSTLSQRRFRQNGKFAYVLFIYNAKAGGDEKRVQLEMTARVLRGGQPVFSGQPRPPDIAEGSTPPSIIVTGGALQLNGMPPGEYTLEVTVVDKLRKNDKRRTARQEIDFTIE
jgi:VWFA-related protein